MPELPEVETVVRDLRPELTGRRVVGVSRSPTQMRRAQKLNWGQKLFGLTWKGVTRRGKWIVHQMTDGSHLLIHLGMTGQLQVHKPGQWQADHMHLEIDLDDGRILQFRDIRRFGAVRFLETRESLEGYFESEGLGPEPFGVDPEYWATRYQESQRNLKALLLDQGIVVGVGNIYADEALFRSRLDPTLRGCDLTAAQAETLRKTVEEVLKEAISQRGSTIRDYVGGSGLEGGFQMKLRVYAREGEPCLKCKTPIERIELAGRSTHFCPKCQTGKRKPR